MRKLNGKCVVWPVYLDASKTRMEGRKIPKKLALNSPQVEEIVKAAGALNLTPNPVLDARFPRFWWQKSGYAVVKKQGSKNKTLLKLVEKIAEQRKT